MSASGVVVSNDYSDDEEVDRKTITDTLNSVLHPDFIDSGVAQGHEDLYRSVEVDISTLDAVKEIPCLKINPKWHVLAASIPIEYRCHVVLETWDTAGEWGPCVCCYSNA